MSWCHIYYITSVILYIYSGYVIASEYYVSAAPNGVDCPSTGLPCHDLSYYIADNSSYFTDDAIFYFLEGTHSLQGTLNISNVTNIMLQGLGHIEQGFHETVMQSTSVIRCSDREKAGIQVDSSSDIVLKSLTIANCGFHWHQYYDVSLFILDSSSVNLEWVSVQNGSGDGLFLLDVYDVIIANSSFANNGNPEIFVGNAYIVYDDNVNRLARVSILKSNFTLGLGYGMYFGCAYNNEVDVIVKNNMFSSSIAGHGGGVSIGMYGSGTIEFSNCTIYNNTAQYGGGVFIQSYSSIVLNNCYIYNNTAQVNGGGVMMYTLGSGNIKYINNTIYNNTAQSYGGGMYISSYDDNSLIMFDGHNMFVNNSGTYGGGISLHKPSQLSLNQNANITFVKNHASKSGGGIFVSPVLVADNNTDCSFKVIPHHYPYDTRTVLYFVNNTADISGDVLYGGKIDDCTSTLYFDHLFQYPQQTGLSVVSSDPIQVCFCKSNRPNCSITSISIFVTPGYDVNVSLATVGILDGLTQGVIKLNSSGNSSIVQYHNNRLNAVCTNVTFALRTSPLLDATQVYATLNSSVTEPLYDPYVKVIEITIKPCPIGFPLVNGKCTCRPEFNSGSKTCDIKTQNITRHGDMWIGYENKSHCLIVYSNCPFHYCNDSNISFTLNDSSKQCLHSRSGMLCGQCSEGFSLMLGYNECERCNNDHIALIIPFALAGIALVAFVIALNLTVSVGTINGLIFYANVVKLYEPIFFPKHSVIFLSQFISWINLDLGIKTCFYHNMGSCSKMWLQFVFPAYVWLIIIFIIILLRYSSKVVKLVGRQIIPVLATMILLSYTKLIRTVFQALHSTRIPCTDDKNNTVSLLRWYIDANVHYGRGCHLPLFLLSLAVLILVIVPYTIYLLTIQLFEGPLSKYTRCYKEVLTYMKPFFDAYGGPYKDKYRFWTGFLLLVRVILALVVSLDTDGTKSLDVLTSLLIFIIFMYYIFKGIYRHFLLGFLEEFFILNLMFMAYMNAQTLNENDDSKGKVSSIVLVSISFVVFCGIIFYHIWDRLIFYHVWDRLLNSYLEQTITKVKNIFKKPPPPTSSNNLELSLMDSKPPINKRKSTMSVVSVDMKRESILFDTDDYD